MKKPAMIREYEQFHGIVLSRLAHKFGEISISTTENSDNCSYIINGKCGIYIKFSKKRLPPWQFSFNLEHYRYIEHLSKISSLGYVIFVCGMDGLCCISFDDFFFIIQPMKEVMTKTISISRYKNQQYQVNGTDNKLKNKFADGEILLQ